MNKIEFVINILIIAILITTLIAVILMGYGFIFGGMFLMLVVNLVIACLIKISEIFLE